MLATDSKLARDIACALKQSPFKAKGQPIETLALVARGVVAHLGRCGWRFELGRPVGAHGPAFGPESGPETRGSRSTPQTWNVASRALSREMRRGGPVVRSYKWRQHHTRSGNPVATAA